MGLRGTFKSLMPLIAALLSIVCFTIAAFVVEVYRYPLWIREGGIIETLSALGYFLCALFMMYKGGWQYIKKYHYFFMLVVAFGLRELDFDKRFTEIGVLQSKFYSSAEVTVFAKLVGAVVVLTLLYIIATIIKNHFKNFVPKLKFFSPVHIGVIAILFFLVFVKTVDGVARKLLVIDVSIEYQTALLFETLEEVLELGIPLLIFSTLIIFYQKNSI